MNPINRRTFLTALPASLTPALAASAQGPERSPGETSSRDKWGDLLPTRPLGRTGYQVTMLGVGGYHVGWTSEKEAAGVIEAALEGGVRFFDTAESYQHGESERRFGKYLVPNYRDEVFIMTKSTARDAKTAREHLDGSLKRLRTDRLDLWQIHAIWDPEDVDERLENGVLNVFQEAKASGKVKYIGFTGHTSPEAHLRMLELTADTDPFDACQMPVNAMDPNENSFLRQVTPRLQERDIGLLAMKTLADGRFFALKRSMDEIQWETDDPIIPRRFSVRDALHYAWAQPISVLITGAENPSLMREKIDLARTFTGMSEKLQEELVRAAAELAGKGVEYYKG